MTLNADVVMVVVLIGLGLVAGFVARMRVRALALLIAGAVLWILLRPL